VTFLRCVYIALCTLSHQLWYIARPSKAKNRHDEEARLALSLQAYLQLLITMRPLFGCCWRAVLVSKQGGCGSVLVPYVDAGKGD